MGSLLTDLQKLVPATRLWGRFPHRNILFLLCPLNPAALLRSHIFFLSFNFPAIHSLEVIRPLPSADRQARFRSKTCRTRAGVADYGYRYYDPLTGRWPSRDPIAEKGGVNLYGFVRNDGHNKIDILGTELIWPDDDRIPRAKTVKTKCKAKSKAKCSGKTDKDCPCKDVGPLSSSSIGATHESSENNALKNMSDEWGERCRAQGGSCDAAQDAEEVLADCTFTYEMA
jgi:RHS repeat-associated protein